MNTDLLRIKSTLQRIIDADTASTKGPWKYLNGAIKYSPDGVFNLSLFVDRNFNVEQREVDASFIIAAKTYSAPMAKALLEAISALEWFSEYTFSEDAERAKRHLQSIISTFPKE